MGKIKSIYDAIVKTKIEEDQCTYFLFWLLQQLPFSVFEKILNISGLKIKQNINGFFSFSVQYTLEKSRPDAFLNINNRSDYIFVETKIRSNQFDKQQFVKHIQGGIKEFGKQQSHFLFISSNKTDPEIFADLQKIYDVQIGCITWSQLLAEFSECRTMFRSQYDILINEFIIFANHYRLGKIMNISKEEMNIFISNYPLIAKFQEPASDKLNSCMQKLMDQIILDSNERIEEDKEDSGNINSVRIFL